MRAAPSVADGMSKQSLESSAKSKQAQLTASMYVLRAATYVEVLSIINLSYCAVSLSSHPAIRQSLKSRDEVADFPIYEDATQFVKVDSRLELSCAFKLPLLPLELLCNAAVPSSLLNRERSIAT